MRYEIVCFIGNAFGFLFRHIAKLLHVDFEVARDVISSESTSYSYEVKARVVRPGTKFTKKYLPLSSKNSR